MQISAQASERKHERALVPEVEWRLDNDKALLLGEGAYGCILTACVVDQHINDVSFGVNSSKH